MNYCPECGIKLSDLEKSENKCWACAGLLPSVASKQNSVGPVKPTRKLPETDEEREEAYASALARLEAYFKSIGFESYVIDNGTLMVGKGSFLLDVKIVENDGRTAYVTSGPKYNPDKAGTKESNATVVTSRSVMKSRKIARITVARRMGGRPVFVELRKNIADPEAHICKSVLFVLHEAVNSSSQLHKELTDISALKDVPPEWMPKASDYDTLFGIPQSSDDAPVIPI